MPMTSWDRSAVLLGAASVCVAAAAVVSIAARLPATEEPPPGREVQQHAPQAPDTEVTR
ncbi:hypothetical protein SAMN05421805_101764 [Saccharopolyspora antimicrobica]|uniref:Uncharacterized protein n=2 Tax=Saccharopolyspora antimicrobica TaxID=455193 RepID=A0A1I4RZ58_9PSEU|nr:hypothetical protein ATL45_7662 [Saccharopolyspora antimicrobica]SFM57582.1 hypothetical protein SAMN05421805_101764 [Saccharopolyspora antimicrobica]